MKTIAISLRSLFAFGLLGLVPFFTACQDDDKPTPDTGLGYPRIVLACDMNVIGSDISYLIPATDALLSGGEAPLSLAYEVYGNAYIEPYKEWLFHLPVWKEATLYRYRRNADGTITPDASLQLSPNAGAGLANLLFLSDTKAYASLILTNQIVVFNPTTMTLTKTIDLSRPELTFDGLGTPNPGDMVYRDGKVFVGCFELADMPICLPGAHMIVIDEATDTPEKRISDSRATSATFFNNSIFTDERGDIYLTCWASYGYAGPDQKGGFLRIPKGKTDFDPDYFFNITDGTFTGIEGGKLQYIGNLAYADNGIAYALGMCPAYFTGDWVNDKTHYSLRLDLYKKTVTPLPLPRTSSYSCAVFRLGDEFLFGLATTDAGNGVFSYNHRTGTASSAPILSAPGTVSDMAIFDE
jgi:hypothetical protein